MPLRTISWLTLVLLLRGGTNIIEETSQSIFSESLRVEAEVFQGWTFGINLTDFNKIYKISPGQKSAKITNAL